MNKKVRSKKILDEIKIAKAFCHANNCYGAESYINGFSGYGLELLVYYYGGFLRFIKAVSKMKDTHFARTPRRRENLLKQAPNNIQKNIVTKGIKIGKSSEKIESKLNKTIKEVTEQIENFKYNLAVIKIRDLFNSLPEKTSKDVLEKSLKLLHPFCPHITEELWSKIGNNGLITSEKWPIVDEKKINEKFEKEEQAIEKLKSDIEKIKKLTCKTDTHPNACFRNPQEVAKNE